METNNLDPLNENQVPHKTNSAESVEPKTAYFSTAIRQVLDQGKIEDTGDKQLVEAALSFIESPKDDFEEIKNHSENISSLLAYGVEPTKELDAMHARLLTLLYQHHVHACKTELSSPDCDIAKAKHLAQWVLDDALGLAAYKQTIPLLIAGKLVADCKAKEIRQ